MDQADPEAARYLASRQRNAEAIELFARFCGNVRVEVMGGRGMLEAATGLPIAHRAFRCAYASGTVAYSMHLEDAAVEFYEQHCRGCGDRVRSGLLGDNVLGRQAFLGQKYLPVVVGVLVGDGSGHLTQDEIAYRPAVVFP